MTVVTLNYIEKINEAEKNLSRKMRKRQEKNKEKERKGKKKNLVTVVVSKEEHLKDGKRSTREIK